MRRDFIDSFGFGQAASPAGAVVVRLRASYLLDRWQKAPIATRARGADP